MGTGSANIRSPEALQRFRHRYLEFDKRARTALDLIAGDLRSVSDWIEREQLPYWRVELRRRSEMVKEAWRKYVDARYGDRRMGKPSCVDERKIYERSRIMKTQAEEKIKIVERWKIALEREGEKLMPPCRIFGTLLDTVTPKAVARLDHMMDRLEDYLRPASAGPTSDPTRKTAPEGSTDAASQSSGTDDPGGPERPGA